jgi:capsular exopolysaccharide synthesis family protein
MESTQSQDLDFQKLWLILKQRWVPAVSMFSCISALTVGAVCLQKPVYKADGKLFIRRVNQTSAVTGMGEQIGSLDGVAQQSNPVKTEVEVISSIPLIQKTITALNLKEEDDTPLKAKDFLKKHFKVKNLPLTDVLQLSYQSNDPQEAAAVVNKLMNLYIENNQLVNRAAAGAAGYFIGIQLPQSQKAVRQAEIALLKFRQQNYVVNLDEEAKSTVSIIKDLEGKITETQAELANANARYANLQSKVNLSSDQGIAVNSLNQSLGVQNVLKEYQQTEDELSVQRTVYQDNHPTIVTLKLKAAALKALLQKRIEEAGVQQQVPNRNLQIGESKQKLNEELVKIEAERLGLANQLKKLSDNLTTYKQRMNILPKLEEQQRELQRQLDAAQSTYEILLKKFHEVSVAQNESLVNGRIIEPAEVPDKRSLKQPAITLGLGMMIAILASGATIAILEVSDKSITTLKQARELFGYTLLGTIPNWSKKATANAQDTERAIPQVPVRNNSHLLIAEAYRMIQANLKFLSSDKTLQVIVVTSSIPKEGKSTVSANLAATMAQLGRRVLLVDADMRHPIQHHIWSLTNATGLSDVIVGQAEFQTSVTEVMTNLEVLPSGVIPPTPLALLDSKRMASLIESFSEQYDFVIIDAPPLIVAADALTLGKMTDGVLLVARPGVVNSTSVNAAKKLLTTAGQNVLGLVVNGVSQKDESDSYFHFSQEYYGQQNAMSYENAIS